MIVIALGGNVRGRHGGPRRTLRWALERLDEEPVRLLRASRLWRCAPFGPVAQPPFINAVAIIETTLSPRALMRFLKRLENEAGRRRGPRWGPRALDLDLIDYRGLVRRPTAAGGQARGLAAHAMQRRGLMLPHPGIAERAFVLAPLAEVAACWRHPVTGRSAEQMLSALPERVRAMCRPLKEDDVSG